MLQLNISCLWLSALVSKAQDIVNESDLLDKLEYIIASKGGCADSAQNIKSVAIRPGKV